MRVDFPLVELHVHLEGSMRPTTLLKLAKRNGVELPAQDLVGLQQWMQFRDFPHFVEVYTKASSCIRTPDDIELLVREFLDGQAAQRVLYTEAHYTANTILNQSGISWPDQRKALQRGVEYGRKELGLELQFILDIVRDRPVEEGERIADWVIEAHGDPVCALGISGFELQTPISKHAKAIESVREAGIPLTIHAGETQGPESIKEALAAGATRIGHGVRCIEDPFLVKRLRDEQIHLEVCPSSNVCLGVFESIESHTLGRLLDEGLNVSINSDDPPMFSTTISNEWALAGQAFELDRDIAYTLNLNAVNAAFLSDAAKRDLRARIRDGFSEVSSD